MVYVLGWPKSSLSFMPSKWKPELTFWPTQYTREFYLAIQKGEITPFAATWMVIEIIKVLRGGIKCSNTYDITYMWNLKNDANEFIYKTGTDWEFPAPSVVGTPCFHHRGQRFSLWSGNHDPSSHAAQPKRKKID